MNLTTIDNTNAHTLFGATSGALKGHVRVGDVVSTGTAIATTTAALPNPTTRVLILRKADGSFLVDIGRGENAIFAGPGNLKSGGTVLSFLYAGVEWSAPLP